MTGRCEHEISEAFVALASSLGKGSGGVELLTELTTRCAAILDITSAGALLADPTGTLHVVAASSEEALRLELFQLQCEDGPCSECFRQGRVINVPDIHAAAARWPRFALAATEAGVLSLHVLPIQLRGRTLGTLELLKACGGELEAGDRELAEALTRVASIALVQDETAADAAKVTQQLQHALNSRIVLEQAKGVLAQLSGLEMDEAFALMRRYARDHNLRLTDVAKGIACRELSAEQLIAHIITRPPPQRRERRGGR